MKRVSTRRKGKMPVRVVEIHLILGHEALMSYQNRKDEEERVGRKEQEGGDKISSCTDCFEML